MNNIRTYGWARIVGAACIMLIVRGLLCFSFAKPSDELPGDEITEDQFFDFIVPQDSVKKDVPKTSPYSPTWIEQAYKTWEAPPLPVQVAEDKENILMGMGAVYIPYMSDPAMEPEIEIVDSTGEVVASGKAGRKYSLLPGKYYVMLGNGAHNQKVVRPVTITESKVTPLIPSWCGVSIDVVDENNQPFRGEYELARIDKFVPFGRGFGRDPDLGENIKTWVLKPGIYKIFGVGQSYNTLTNFVTLRLLPGEFLRFTLVQKENTLEIIGGGLIQIKGTTQITSNWKYGVDVGGSIDFNATYNYKDTLKNIDDKSVSLLLRSNLNFKKSAIEWDNRLWLNEGVKFSKWDLDRLQSSTDELRFVSLFTWRFFPWLGPYGRLEAITEFFSRYEQRPENVPSHYFILVDEDYYLKSIDSVSASYKMQPPFSPFTFETGAGANINALKKRYLETRLLTGIGLKYKSVWDESEKITDTSNVEHHLTNTDLNNTYDSIVNKTNSSYAIIRNFNSESSIELGPEAVLYVTLLLGRYINVESELKYFSPFDRMERPDFTLRSTIGWRVLRMLTLDYEYQYILKQPKEEALKQNESRHRVLVRFSYTSR